MDTGLIIAFPQQQCAVFAVSELPFFFFSFFFENYRKKPLLYFLLMISQLYSFGSASDCRHILFDCWRRLCVVGLTVIQNVSLYSWCLCLETAGRDRDFRKKKEDEGGIPKGFSPRGRTYFLRLGERLHVPVCRRFNLHARSQTALCVTFIHIKSSTDT